MRLLKVKYRPTHEVDSGVGHHPIHAMSSNWAASSLPANQSCALIHPEGDTNANLYKLKELSLGCCKIGYSYTHPNVIETQWLLKRHTYRQVPGFPCFPTVGDPHWILESYFPHFPVVKSWIWRGWFTWLVFQKFGALDKRDMHPFYLTVVWALLARPFTSETNIEEK